MEKQDNKKNPDGTTSASASVQLKRVPGYEKKHALLSPSSAYRWLNCTPSAVAESQEEDQSSSFAEEGSLAHAVCARELNERLNRSTVDAEDEITALVEKGYEVTEEMERYATDYTEFVMETYFGELAVSDGKAEIHVETPLDLDTWAPDSFGTSDVVIVGQQTLHVIDFKYGKGVEVSAAGNPQMRLYALGALEEFGLEHPFERVVTHIWQPRISNYSREEISTDELITWGLNYCRPLANVAVRGLGVRHGGAWCKFCKASRGCRALDEMAVIASATPVESMSAEGIGNVCMPMVGPLEQWIEDVKESALKYMLDGQAVPGYKVVEARTQRKVSDPVKLADVLRGMGYREEEIMKAPELQTLTNLERLVGKKAFAEAARDCIMKAPGKPTVVPDSDRRASYKATDAFSNIAVPE